MKCRLQSLDSKGDQVSDIYTKLIKSRIIRYSDCVKLFEHLSNKCNEMLERCRPFLSYLKPLFQSEAKCKAIDVKSYASITHFHNKGFALSLVLKVKGFGTQKWPFGLRLDLRQLNI